MCIRDRFQLDSGGRRTQVAGVPPDYFSATGQLWGNPLYDWERMRENGFRWWIERFRAVYRLVDIARVDPVSYKHLTLPTRDLV